MGRRVAAFSTHNKAKSRDFGGAVLGTFEVGLKYKYTPNYGPNKTLVTTNLTSHETAERRHRFQIARTT